MKGMNQLNQNGSILNCISFYKILAKIARSAFSSNSAAFVRSHHENSDLDKSGKIITRLVRPA